MSYPAFEFPELNGRGSGEDSFFEKMTLVAHAKQLARSDLSAGTEQQTLRAALFSQALPNPSGSEFWKLSHLNEHHRELTFIKSSCPNHPIADLTPYSDLQSWETELGRHVQHQTSRMKKHEFGRLEYRGGDEAKFRAHDRVAIVLRAYQPSKNRTPLRRANLKRAHHLTSTDQNMRARTKHHIETTPRTRSIPHRHPSGARLPRSSGPSRLSHASILRYRLPPTM